MGDKSANSGEEEKERQRVCKCEELRHERLRDKPLREARGVQESECEREEDGRANASASWMCSLCDLSGF